MVSVMNDQGRRDAAADPIVVPNTLWQAADPLVYNGGQPSAAPYALP